MYCFSNRPPNEALEPRDVINEVLTEEERGAGAAQGAGASQPTEAVLHTNYGDIFIKLFNQECPRTIENFTTHARAGYYDHVLFHRVIKGFMIQTGTVQ